MTALYCELIAPLDRKQPLSAEERHELLNRFSSLMLEEVRRYNGTVNGQFEQGYMALFGATVALEDHPRRAVLAAQAILDRMVAQKAEVALRHGVEWRTRMGLDTGPIVTGGVGSAMVGEALRGADQLRQLAPPDTILLSRNLAHLVQPYAKLAREELTPPGGGRLEAWRVVEARPQLGSGRVLREDASSPFVGREHELSTLLQLREQAEGGQGQVVGIAGEAGAGKSRLLHEFYRRTFRGRQVSYLRGQCSAYGSGVPYLPLVDMIRKASRIAEGDTPAEVVEKMRASLELVGTDPDSSLPYFLRLLGIEDEALATLEPQAVKARTFATLRRMLLDASQRALVVVEIEDVHWIDETSAEFLDSLVEDLGAARLMLVVTYRSGYQPRWLEKSYATQLTLRRLSAADSRQLAAAIWGDDAPAPERVQEILGKAEGNPLFLEELARSLIDRGDAADAAIPDTIQGILMARIDRLPELHKLLLKTVAVLGREFSCELLTALWDRPEDPLVLLEELRRWELLYKAPAEDQPIYFFKHALAQEVVYESLLTQQRRTLHRRAAEALERLYADRLEDAYDRLIYHYPRAGESEKTVHYLTLFAARAARGYAHAEAARALREALPHAEQLPSAVQDRRVVEVALALAESLLPLASFPETLALCERYAERVERLAEPSLTARYHFWLAHTHTYLGNQEETRRHAQLAIDAAREPGDEATEGKACYVLGRDGFWSGRFADGIRYSLQAVVLLERSGEVWWQGQANWVAGFNHFVLGEHAKGIQALERACAIGEALDDYRLDASWSLGYFYASLGDAERGIEACQRGLDRARDPLNSAVAGGFLGYAHLRNGEIARAVSLLRDAVERLREAGMQQIVGWFSTFLGEARLAAGELEEAREMATRGLEAARAAAFRYGVGLAHQTLGRIARQAGEVDEARQQLQQAREMFVALQVPFETARTRLEEARLARDCGADPEAAQALDEGQRLFVELGLEPPSE